MNHETIAIIAPIALALTEVAKRVMGWEKENVNAKRFLPLVSMVLGVCGAWVISPYATNVEIIINGLLAGLVACGVYDFGSKTIAGK